MSLEHFKTPRQILMEKFHEVVNAVAKEDHVTVTDLMSGSNYREHTSARRKAVQRMRAEMPNLTLKRISELFGREHTAISHLLGNTAASKIVTAKQAKQKIEKPVEMVECACGCGMLRPRMVKGEIRHYINGHQPHMQKRKVLT